MSRQIELFQFQGSPFNEKARWALEWKGLTHERISLLPGPHVRTIQKLSGQAKTPVLRYAGQVVPGSAQIIDTLETRHPAPPLYPADASQRARALEIQREFDEEVGPAVRCAKFFEVMDPAYVKQVFAHHKPWASRTAYGFVFRFMSPRLKSQMNVNAETAAAALERTRKAFDWVAKTAGSEGYLVGDSFSVADLTCASHLMPTADLCEWGGPTDAETPKNEAWKARWADHPGLAWVREIYRRHRRC